MKHSCTLSQQSEISSAVASMEQAVGDCPMICTLLCEELLSHLVDAGYRDIALSARRFPHRCIEIRAAGEPDMLVRFAHCCNPVMGDEIVGFITRGRGVSVHRASCPNVKGLMGHPERMIAVEWDSSGATEFQVEIVVEATDRMGLLKDVTETLGSAGANILSAATQTSTAGVARLRFLIAISDASLLEPLLAAVSRVPSVFDCRRIMPGEGANQMRRRA